VVGLGSSVACHLAQRGKRVLGLEQFAAVHDKGSSHGSSCIIRQTYYEDPSYMPLLVRAYELWQRLRHDTGAKIINVPGGIMIGPTTSRVVSGSILSAKEHNLAHEVLEANDIPLPFPPVTPARDEIAL
jgi:sarcosine oxidase